MSAAREGVHHRHAVKLLEPNALGGQLVDVRGLDLAAAIAEVGVAEIIGHDEDDVGPLVLRQCRAAKSATRLGRLRLSASSHPPLVLFQLQKLRFSRAPRTTAVSVLGRAESSNCTSKVRWAAVMIAAL